MVGSLCAVFGTAILCLILFMIYGIKNKAKSDRAFRAISLTSVALLLAHGFNMAFVYSGDWGILISKICYSTYISLFVILLGILTFIQIDNFNGRSNYGVLVKFVVTIIIAVIIFCDYINVFDERFFNYIVRDINFLSLFTRKTPKIVIWYPGKFWNILIFFWALAASIYALLTITRITMRGAVNSINEFIVVAIFFVIACFFGRYLYEPHALIFIYSLFCCFIPPVYYYLLYKRKSHFVRRSLRSKLFENSNKMLVIFDADDKLVDFNHTAQDFFGFTSKDINNFNIHDFIRDYVPLGNVPSDSLSVEQISVKQKGENRVTCQLDYKRITNFKNITICSFFILNNISSIMDSFAEIQEASMIDHITGLLAQHVLMKKIREINIFRRFPYSAASCSIQIKNPRPELSENFALVKVAECIKTKIRGSDFASYENGTIVLLFPAEYNVAQNVMERIVAAIEDEEYLRNDIKFQYGLTCKDTPDEDIQQTINRAHAIMFKSKIESSINGLNTLLN